MLNKIIDNKIDIKSLEYVTNLFFLIIIDESIFL